jgi:hypothetical protein
LLPKEFPVNGRYLLVFIAVLTLMLMSRPGELAKAQEELVTTDGIPAVSAAVEAVNRSFPGIGQPHLFTYSFTEPTRDSSLGCPLVDGYLLPAAVVPYRITLFYGDRQFTYHATADGSIVVPCDEALPIGGPLPPGAIPFTAAATTPAQAAIEAFLRTSPSHGFPHSYTYTSTTPTTDSSLGCPLIEGFRLDRPVVPYRVVLSYPDGQFVYHVAGDISILFPCDEQLPVGGPLPPGSQPFRPGTPVEAAISAFTASFPDRVFPDRYEYLILDPFLDGPVASCRGAGTAVSVNDMPYKVTLYSQNSSYVYFVSADGSTVVACNA